MSSATTLSANRLAMRAVVIRRGGIGGQIHVTELFVGAHHRPDRDLAGIFIRSIGPGVTAELAFRRNGLECPAHLAGPHIKGANPSGDLFLGLDQRRDRRRRDDEILDDDGR
jgi:hypothetical protein